MINNKKAIYVVLMDYQKMGEEESRIEIMLLLIQDRFKFRDERREVNFYCIS